jgi:hypothetical protein
MDSGDTDSRRKNARIALDELVSFNTFAGANSLGQGEDVCLGGMRFKALGCSLMYDELLRVSFNVRGQTIEAVGRVVRMTKLDDITTEVALEFVRIDPWAVRLLEEAMGSE